MPILKKKETSVPIINALSPFDTINYTWKRRICNNWLLLLGINPAYLSNAQFVNEDVPITEHTITFPINEKLSVNMSIDKTSIQGVEVGRVDGVLMRQDEQGKQVSSLHVVVCANKLFVEVVKADFTGLPGKRIPSIVQEVEEDGTRRYYYISYAKPANFRQSKKRKITLSSDKVLSLIRHTSDWLQDN